MDRQDPALLRAGRVDRTFKFSAPGDRELRAMLRSFYPDATEAAQERFAAAVADRSETEARSIATLQELFIWCQMQQGGFAETADQVVDKFDDFFQVFFPHRKSKVSLYT